MVKRDDFNIYEFHQNMVQTISSVSDIELLQSQSDIKTKLNQTNSNEEIKWQNELKYQKELKEIHQKLSIWYDFNSFNIQVNELVQKFYALLNCTIVNSFTKKKKPMDENINKQKLQLIHTYIEQIQQYPLLYELLPTFHDTISLKMCSDCNVELEVYEHNLICPQCCCEQPYIHQEENVSFKDFSRINTNIKYSYIRQTHFKDTIKQFQGKQNKYIDESVYKTLYSCFDTALFTKNEHGKYNTVTKDHIKMFLQQNGLYKYYEDMNLIYQTVTGVPCPNIEEYEKQLMIDFERLLVAYDKVIKEDSAHYERSNFLNSYYVLFQLLKKNAYPCKETDFPIIKTVDRKIEHDEIYEKCCKQLGWFFQATV